MDNIKIKILNENDLRAFERLLSDLSAIRASGWSWQVKDGAVLLSTTKVLGCMAAADGSLMAFLSYRDVPGALEIFAIATHPEARKQGIGSLLIGHLKGLRTAGQELWLEVSSQNPAAITLYQSQGFRIVGERPNYYSDGASALVMTLPDETLA